MDLASSQRLNKWWQELFDKKHPEVARRRRAADAQWLCRDCGVERRWGIDDCPECGSGHIIRKDRLRKLGAPKVVRKSLSKSFRTRTSGR